MIMSIKTKKTLAIIGAGHLGQQIAHYAVSDQHYNNVVFFDDFNKNPSVNGYKILGPTDSVIKFYQKKIFDELIIGIGYKHLSVRKELFEKLNGKVPFGNIIHTSVWKDQTAQVGAGCVIYPCCKLDANVVVKANTILNIACTIAHDTVIESHSFLSPRVAVAGFVTILQECIIGINSTIIDHIKITNKVQIGGGTVVIKSINKEGLYVGNPHRFIR